MCARARARACVRVRVRVCVRVRACVCVCVYVHCHEQLARCFHRLIGVVGGGFGMGPEIKKVVFQPSVFMIRVLAVSCLRVCGCFVAVLS